MEWFTPILVFAGVVVTSLITYFVARRKNSGRIDTTEATELWIEATRIRRELRQEVKEQRAQIKDQAEQLQEARSEISLLRDRVRILEAKT